MAFKHDISDVKASVDGKIVSSPELIKRFGGERIFEVKIECKRTSGVVDTFKLNYSSNLGVVLKKNMFIHIEGDIRTVNSTKESDLVVGCIIFAKSVKILDDEPELYCNEVFIDNAKIHEFISIRKSYNDDTIDVADYKISVHRGHGRYSYFKASSFDGDAIFIGNVHKSIKSLTIKCRLCGSKSRDKSDRCFFYLAVYHLDAHFKDKEDKE